MLHGEGQLRDCMTTMCTAQVLHPKGFTGTVTVSLPKLPALQPLTYNVVSHDLVVQSLGFSICPLSFGAH